LASSAPFLCLIVAHFEWPDMARPRAQESWLTRNSPLEEITGCLDMDEGEQEL